MSEAEKSQSKLSPLSDEDLKGAEANLVRCLDAYDQKGDAGLEEEVRRIHPDSSIERTPIFGPGSFARKLTPEQRARVNNALSTSSSQRAKKKAS